MTLRQITECIPATETQDGEGVSIRRTLGLRPHRWHDPFLMLDEFYSDGPEAGPGFPDHPHRGFSTLTYMLKGHMNHADNHGNAGRVGPGGFQWMTAGRGIIHSERPEVEEDGMRGLQLWINLPGPLKMGKPFYINGEMEDSPVVKMDGASIKVLGGTIGNQTGPITDDVTNLIYFDINLGARATLNIPVPETHQGMVYGLSGKVTFMGADSQVLSPHMLGLLSEGDAISVLAGEDGARFVLMAAIPIHEPIARYGPFVMNTRQEIETAISDYQQGKF